jgi:hypothetical protein
MRRLIYKMYEDNMLSLAAAMRLLDYLDTKEK